MSLILCVCLIRLAKGDTGPVDVLVWPTFFHRKKCHGRPRTSSTESRLERKDGFSSGLYRTTWELTPQLGDATRKTSSISDELQSVSNGSGESCSFFSFFMSFSGIHVTKHCFEMGSGRNPDFQNMISWHRLAAWPLENAGEVAIVGSRLILYIFYPHITIITKKTQHKLDLPHPSGALGEVSHLKRGNFARKFPLARHVSIVIQYHAPVWSSCSNSFPGFFHMFSHLSDITAEARQLGKWW